MSMPNANISGNSHGAEAAESAPQLQPWATPRVITSELADRTAAKVAVTAESALSTNFTS